MSSPKNITNQKKHGLGRGFESLIPTDLLDESFDPTADQDQKVSELRQIKVDQITVDANQPRKVFDPEALEELVMSVREHGVLQPIIVTPHKGGYMVVAGERRFRAAKQAGLDKIPALVRTLTDQHRLEISLIENLRRQDLNAMETATAYQKLRVQFNLSLKQIRDKVGCSSIATVSNTLRLFKLPDFVQDLIADGKIVEGQARPLIGLDPDDIKFITDRILKESWSSRKVEQFIVNLKNNKSATEKDKLKKAAKHPYEKQQQKIKKHLDADIQIHTNSRGAGYIKIAFKNDADFDRLQKIIS